jgi:hypothetical protein
MAYTVRMRIGATELAYEFWDTPLSRECLWRGLLEYGTFDFDITVDRV